MTRPGAALLCIGNITIDEAVQPDGARSVALGGDALYAALAARAHLSRVAWLAPVGHDVPRRALDELAEAGLREAGPVERELPTVRNVVTYHRDGGRDWRLVHGWPHFTEMSVHPADMTAEMLAHDGILVSAMSPDAQLSLVRWLRRNTSATVYLDVQEDELEGSEAAWHQAISCSDVFLPSEVEAVALAGTADMALAARRFRALGPRTVVIKLAERGCLVLDGDGPPVEVPARAVQPVDSTGAGDAFCGAFAAVHLRDGDAMAAARAGAASALAAIGAPGFRGLLGTVRAARGEVPAA